MADNAEHYYVNPNYDMRNDASQDSAPPSSREEYAAMEQKRNSRRASPPISEASNVPSLDRGESSTASINTVSPELLAQITEQITEQIKKQGMLICPIAWSIY
jgi:hypothetical protein